MRHHTGHCFALDEHGKYMGQNNLTKCKMWVKGYEYIDDWDMIRILPEFSHLRDCAMRAKRNTALRKLREVDNG